MILDGQKVRVTNGGLARTILNLLQDMEYQFIATFHFTDEQYVEFEIKEPLK